MKYQRITTPKWQRDVYALSFATLLFALLLAVVNQKVEAHSKQEFLTPLASDQTFIKEVVREPEGNIDTWISTNSTRFATNQKPESYLKYQLHCLANKESGHRYNSHTKCGDGGKSCGLFQYRQPTWEMFRKQMIASGEATKIGSLWNDELQIETTAWALTQDYQNHWGPIVNQKQCL